MRLLSMQIAAVITNSISRGWKLAETNTDGSRATAGQRAYNFMNNGGGTVTYRVVVPVLISVIGVLVGLMWNDLKDGQHMTLEKLDQHTTILTEQGKSIVSNTARIDGMQSGQQRIWLKLGEHDNKIDEVKERVTHLEACQPICKPR